MTALFSLIIFWDLFVKQTNKQSHFASIKVPREHGPFNILFGFLEPEGGERDIVE